MTSLVEFDHIDQAEACGWAVCTPLEAERLSARGIPTTRIPTYNASGASQNGERWVAPAWSVYLVAIERWAEGERTTIDGDVGRTRARVLALHAGGLKTLPPWSSIFHRFEKSTEAREALVTLLAGYSFNTAWLETAYVWLSVWLAENPVREK